MARGIIVPRSNLGNEILDAQGLPLLDTEDVGLGPAVQGGQKLGNDLFGIGLDQQQTTSAAIASDGLNTFEPQWQNRLSEMKKNRRGKNVLALGPLEDDFVTEGLAIRKELRDEILLTMQNGSQRTALSNAIDSRSRFAISSLRNHQDREVDTYERETDTNSAILNANSIATAESDTEVGEHVDAVKANIAKMGARDGWSPETASVELIKLTSPPLVASLKEQAISDPDGAERRMEGYLGQETQILDKLQVPRLRETFQRETLTADAQSAAFQSLALAEPGETSEQTIARVRGATSGKVESEAVRITESTLRLRAADQAAAMEATERSLADQTRNMFEVDPNLAQKPAELESLRSGLRRKAIDDGLSGDAVTQLLGIFDDEAKPKPRQTNWAEFERVKQDPNILRDMSALDIEESFTGGQRTEAFALKQQVRDGELLEDTIVTGEITAEFNKLGWTRANNGADMGQMRAQLEGDIIGAQQQEGTLSRNRRKEIYANRIAQIYDPVGFGSQSIRGNEEIITRAVSSDQNVLALALFNASNGGRRQATDSEIVSRYFHLRRDIDQAGSPEASNALAGQYQANGREARRRLNTAKYEDTSLYNFDALVDQERAEKAANDRATRRAAERAAAREEVIRNPRRSGRGAQFDRGRSEAIIRARDE